MTTPPKETQPSRRGRAAAVGRDAGGVAAGTFSKMGFTDPALVLRWREIAGPEVARLCQPLRFSDGPHGGTLTLKALPGAALFLGHETRTLTDRMPCASLAVPKMATTPFVVTVGSGVTSSTVGGVVSIVQRTVTDV